MIKTRKPTFKFCIVPSEVLRDKKDWSHADDDDLLITDFCERKTIIIFLWIIGWAPIYFIIVISCILWKRLFCSKRDRKDMVSVCWVNLFFNCNLFLWFVYRLTQTCVCVCNLIEKGKQNGWIVVRLWATTVELLTLLGLIETTENHSITGTRTIVYPIV